MLRDESTDPGRRRLRHATRSWNRSIISSIKPTTGFYRDGCCNTGQEEVGVRTRRHMVYAGEAELLDAFGGRAPQIGRFASRSLRTADPRHGVARSERIKVS